MKLSPKVEGFIATLKPRDRAVSYKEAEEFARKYGYVYSTDKRADPPQPEFTIRNPIRFIRFSLDEQTVTWTIKLLPPNEISFTPKIWFSCYSNPWRPPKTLIGDIFRLFVNEFLKLSVLVATTPEPFIKRASFPALKLPYTYLTIEEAQEWLEENTDQISKFYEILGVDPEQRGS